jgi:5-(carboxyamino)imidazole ribonucleotide mutase
MPPGIPVGTMAIDGARNAGIYAAKIIAVGRPELWNDIRKFMKSLEEQVLSKALDLENKGYQKYLEKK